MASSKLVLLFAFCMISLDGTAAFSEGVKFTKVRVGTIIGWRDSENGMIIGNIRQRVGSLQKATMNCPAPWRAPSFGDIKQKGQAGDLAILFKDGILEVYPALVGRSFWLTDTPSPYYETIEFTGDTAHPVLYNYGSSDGSISSVCVIK